MTGFAWLLPLAATLAAQAEPSKEVVIESPFPAYKATLPKGFEAVLPREEPVRYARTAGREDWAKVTLFLHTESSPIAQNPDGVTEALIAPYVPLPPDCKRSFSTARWMDLDIGVFEYHGVEKGLLVVGRVAVLPLRGRAVTLHVLAPEPLEKDMKDDFAAALAGVTGKPAWRTVEVLASIRSYDRVGMAGAVVLLLYLPALLVLFRGNAMKAHWLRTGWLVLAAVLLFIPALSPGDATFLNNLVVNTMLPLVLLLFVGRRIKMGVEML